MTGDHAITAQAVGKQIFLADGGQEVQIITGKELDAMPDDELKQKIVITSYSIHYTKLYDFRRTFPRIFHISLVSCAKY